MHCSTDKPPLLASPSDRPWDMESASFDSICIETNHSHNTSLAHRASTHNTSTSTKSHDHQLHIHLTDHFGTTGIPTNNDIHILGLSHWDSPTKKISSTPWHWKNCVASDWQTIPKLVGLSSTRHNLQAFPRHWRDTPITKPDQSRHCMWCRDFIRSQQLANCGGYSPQRSRLLWKTFNISWRHSSIKVFFLLLIFCTLFACWVIFVVSSNNFSNSLIIHQVKTKKIISVKEVWIPGLN